MVNGVSYTEEEFWWASTWFGPVVEPVNCAHGNRPVCSMSELSVRNRVGYKGSFGSAAPRVPFLLSDIRDAARRAAGCCSGGAAGGAAQATAATAVTAQRKKSPAPRIAPCHAVSLVGAANTNTMRTSPPRRPLVAAGRAHARDSGEAARA